MEVRALRIIIRPGVRIVPAASVPVSPDDARVVHLPGRGIDFTHQEPLLTVARPASTATHRPLRVGLD